MRANEFKVLEDCIEKGIEYGLMKFHKYYDFEIPDEHINNLKQQLEYGISNQICEYFNFDNDGDK